MTIARALLARQRQLGILTKAQLARRIGVSLSTLYNILGENHGVDSRTLAKYARFLGWPLKRVLLSAPRQRHAPAPRARRTQAARRA